jgi:hypothetical protein
LTADQAVTLSKLPGPRGSVSARRVSASLALLALLPSTLWVALRSALARSRAASLIDTLTPLCG